MKRIAPLILFSAWSTLAALVIVGCAAPIHVAKVRPDRSHTHSPHVGYGLTELASLNRPTALEALDDWVKQLAVAQAQERRQPEEAALAYLKLARSSLKALQLNKLDPAAQVLVLREVYQRAVAGYIRCANDDLTLDGRVALDVGPGRWDPKDFDAISTALDYRIDDLEWAPTVAGLGAPIVLKRATRPARTLLDQHYPPEGLFVPGTAVMTATDRQTTLHLYDPRRITQARLSAQGPDLPLAQDKVLPYALLIAQTSELASLGFGGLIDPDQLNNRLGLYLLEPYDPDKIPVLMVHGLLSTPLTWLRLTRHIQADPTLSEHFQVWHFLYPTGPCPYHSAFLLRNRLDEFRARLDPEINDFATQHMIVMGHSMGGLLARTLAIDPGQTHWDAVFNVPPDELVGEEPYLSYIRGAFLHERRQFVKRLIFMASPHGGSEVARASIGRLGSSLVRMPDDVDEALRRIAQDNQDRINEQYRPLLRRGMPTSIQTLKPESYALRAFGKAPIHPDVPFHSIIGTQGPNFTDVAKTSDGVVPYWSSHLPAAQSEALVPTGHNVHEHPLAIAEVDRILRLHLRERGVALD